MQNKGVYILHFLEILIFEYFTIHTETFKSRYICTFNQYIKYEIDE